MEAGSHITTERFLLLGDQPDRAVEDPLGFDRVVRELTTLILESGDSTPYTLGIEATWGMGKSTLMGALQERLRGTDGVTPIQFNAWTAEEGRALEAFIKTVLEKIGAGVLRRALYKQRAISVFRIPVSVVAGKLGISSVVDTAWEKVAEDPGARNDLRQLVEKAVGSWRRGRSKSGDGRLLCIFVDDLDRCSPKVVLEVLEAMKLYLDVPGIVFVVGYDEDIVSDVVLRDKGYGDKTKARDYLEKFIQISYRIPRAEDAQAEALIESLLSSSGVGGLLGENERQLIIERSNSNPRRIKRFINNFIVVHRLDPRLRDFDPTSLVRVLLLQMYFPEFTRLLERSAERDPMEEFLEYAAARGALLKGVQGGAGGDEIDLALKSHGLPSTGGPRQEDPELTLKKLERVVPVEFPQLAARADFVTLASSLAESVDWPSVRLDVSRGALANVVDRDPKEKESFWRTQGFYGLRIIWIDENKEANKGLIQLMIEGGASVTPVADENELAASLDVEQFDLLISDVGRDDDPFAGFGMLSRLREVGAERVPDRVIFYTGRVTPARIEKAAGLRAQITAESDALLNFVAASPRDER